MQRLVRKFGRDRRGNVALMFGLAVLPVAMMVGMGVDVTNATRVKLSLQDATDAAAIALAEKATTIADNQIYPTALSYIRTSYDDTATVTVTNATVDRTNIVATVDAKVSVPTTFSQLLGVSNMSVTSHAIAKGMLLEIALVLDNSGSMADSAGSGGSKIDALKDAAGAFLDAMFGAQTTSQRVTVGVVPFAYSVNVGTGNKTATWMDQGTSSSITSEDFKPKTNPFTVWSTMTSSSWAGCVRTRVQPYDVDDTTPSAGNTLFSPWFMVDEPDDVRHDSTYKYPNNYLDDGGGNCTGNKTGWSDIKLQQRTCKYYHVKSSGPNGGCTTTPITPLTANRTTVDSAINAMQPNGNTNIQEGLMWGWRVLSPNAPFTEGKTYTAPNNRKVVVLMTDGENHPATVSDSLNINKSEYSAFGYSKWGYLVNSNDFNTIKGAMDDRMLVGCENMKAKGMLIYTIAFGSDTDVAGSAGLLKQCASDPSYYYAPKTSNDLKPVFLKIAQSINSLRIAQ